MVDRSNSSAPTSSFEPALMSPRQRALAIWLVHILGSVVVLNLFEEYVDSVVIDSFTVSLLAATVLRVALEGAIWVEHRAADLWDRRPGAASHWLKVVTAWGILFLSKIIILELIDLIFGEHVELGGLVTFIALVIVLLGVEAALGVTFDVVGRRDPPAT